MATEYGAIAVGGAAFPAATPAAKVLNLVHGLCSELPHGHGAFLSLHTRLTTVHDALEQMHKQYGELPRAVADLFVDTLTEYWWLLAARRGMNAVQHLLLHATTLRAMEALNTTVAELFQMLHLATAESMLDWKEELHADMEVQWMALKDASKTTAKLMIELPGLREQGDAIVLLKAEVARIDRGELELPEETMRAVRRAYSKLVRHSRAPVEPVPKWFISESEFTMVARPFGRGSLGTVHRGVYRGSVNVVVKMVLPGGSGVDATARKDFLMEVTAWRDFDHPHVAKVLGACHVTKRPFLVCEEAANGNMATFLAADKTKMWKLLYEAAQGLEYLHNRNVVHGDLSLANLLVDVQQRALVSDFGFSHVKDMSKTRSTTKLKNGEVVEGGLRWRAPECFEIKPVFASDVYSFGMCIFEALTGEPPYGRLDDVAIQTNIENGVLPARPEGITDQVWDLVVAMTKKELKERITIKEAIAVLKELRDKEVGNPTTTMLMCFNRTCGGRTPAGSIVCFKCGTPVKPSVEECVRDLAQKDKNALAAVQRLYQWCASDVTTFVTNAVDCREVAHRQLLETVVNDLNPASALYAFGCVSILKQYDFGFTDDLYNSLRALVDSRIFPSSFNLVEDLEPSDEKKQRLAAEIVTLLVQLNVKNQNAMVDCIPLLAMLCCDASGELRVTALRALAIVTEGHDENLQELRQSTEVSVLLTICIEASDATALRLLAQLTDSVMVAMECATRHNVRLLVSLLEDGSDEIKVHVMDVLANIGEKIPDAARLVGRCGGVASLMDVLASAVDMNQKHHAFKALAELGGYPLNVALFLTEDGATILQEYFAQVSREHISDALWSLSRLIGGSAELQRAVGRSSIVQLCTGLLRSERVDERTRAALVLRELVRGQPHAVEAIETCGGLSSLADETKGRESYAAQTLIGSIRTLLSARSREPQREREAWEITQMHLRNDEEETAPRSSDPDDVSSPVRVVAATNALDTVRLIYYSSHLDVSTISTGSDLTPPSNTAQSSKTALFAACKNGDVELVRRLLASGASTTDVDAGGASVLHAACKKMSADIVNVLLEHHADIDSQDLSGMTPLHNLIESYTSRSDAIDFIRFYDCAYALASHGVRWDSGCADAIHQAAPDGTRGAVSDLFTWWSSMAPFGAGTSLPTVPLDTLRRGAFAVSTFVNDYCASISTDGVRRQKVCVVGGPRSGKSTLIARLTGQPPSSSAVGPIRTTWLDKGDYEFSFWEFSGKGQLDLAHPLFLSSHSLFLVCVDLSRGVGEPEREPSDGSDLSVGVTVGSASSPDANDWRDWMRLIFARHPDACIVLVGTKRDLAASVGDDEVDEAMAHVLNWVAKEKEHLSGVISEKLKVLRTVDTSVMLLPLQDKLSAAVSRLEMLTRQAANMTPRVSISVSCKGSDTTLQSLTNALVETSNPYLFTSRFQNVLAVVRDQIKSAATPSMDERVRAAFVGFEDLYTSVSLEIPGLDKDEFRRILTVFHELGYVLFYQGIDFEPSQRLVILDPRVFIDIVYTSVNGDSPLLSELPTASRRVVTRALCKLHVIHEGALLPRATSEDTERIRHVGTISDDAAVTTAHQQHEIRVSREFTFCLRLPRAFFKQLMVCSHAAAPSVTIDSDDESIELIFTNSVVGKVSLGEMSAGLPAKQHVLAVEVDGMSGDATRTALEHIIRMLESVIEHYPGCFITRRNESWQPGEWAYDEVINPAHQTRPGHDAVIFEDIIYYNRVCLVGPRHWGRTTLARSLTTNTPFVSDRKPGKTEIRVELATGYFIERDSHDVLAKRHVVAFCDFVGRERSEEVQTLFFRQSKLFMVCVDLQAYGAAFTQAQFSTDSQEAFDRKMDAFVRRNVMRWLVKVLVHRPDAEFFFLATKGDILKNRKARIETIRADLMTRLRHQIDTRTRHVDRDGVALHDHASRLLDQATRFETVMGNEMQRWIVVSCRTRKSVNDAQAQVEATITLFGRPTILPKTYATTLKMVDAHRHVASTNAKTRVAETIVKCRELYKSLRAVGGIEKPVFDEVIQVLRGTGEVVTFADLEAVTDVEWDVVGDFSAADHDLLIVDPRLLVDFAQRLIEHALSHSQEHVTHVDLKRQPLWSEVVQPKVIDKIKNVLLDFRCVRRRSKENYWSVIVPAVWQRVAGNHELDVIPKDFLSLSGISSNFAFHVVWKYYMEYSLPFTFFDDLATASYSSSPGRQVYKGLIHFPNVKTRELGGEEMPWVCQAWIERADTGGDARYVVCIEAITNESDPRSHVWRAFKLLCEAMHELRDSQYPDLYITPQAIDEKQCHRSADEVIFDTPDGDVLRWMPPDLKTYTYLRKQND